MSEHGLTERGAHGDGAHQAGHHSTDHGHSAGHGQGAAEHGHPGPVEYLKIGAILFVLTVIEVAIVYVEAFRPWLVASLMVLMVIKFALVVLWFMHLKFDNRLFSTLFTAPLVIATCIVLALIALFSFYVGGEAVVAAH